MTAVTTSISGETRSASGHRRMLRRVLAGGAALDATMGVVCLVAAPDLGDWLSIGTAAVRSIGVVFLVAAVAGVETLLRPSLGTRWIVGANVLFAVWCIGAIAFDAPSLVGAALLAASAAAAAGTAVTEHWLGTPR